jgi:hypothetical protein
MKPLDDQLRELFRRKEPPEGFAERVLARIEKEPQRQTAAQRTKALFWQPMLRWVAVAAVVSVVAVVGITRYQHQQRLQAQAEQASQQAMVALRITNDQIDAALERAQNVTVRALEVRRNLTQGME